MKKCHKCGRELPLDDFYKHPQMLDGHLNICKSCVKDRVNKYREANIEKIRAYDRERAHLEKRKILRAKISAKRRHEVQGYKAAHMAVAHAIKKGALKKPNRCQYCGRTGRIEGHHKNYKDKLNVIWLCSACHRQYHLGKAIQAQKIRSFVNGG